MRQRFLSVLAMTLILGGLWLIPVKNVWAAEEDQSEETEQNPAGPGAALIMIGIASLAAVGGWYMLQQGRDNGEQPQQ